MINHLFILMWSFMLIPTASTCQPPLGAPQALSSGISPQLDQQPQLSMAYLPSSHQVEHSSRPLEPISVGIEQTNSIAEPTLLHSEQGFTPYPGYIPPPPASMSVFPTLQGSATLNSSRAGTIPVPSLSDVSNSVVASSLPDQIPMCPVELRFLSDFAACIQPQLFVPSNQESISCNFEDGSFCRFQPTSSLFQIGKLPLPSHYATLAELSGRAVVYQPQRNFVYVLAQQPLAKEEELVIAAPITCQRGGGLLKFSYWLIGDRSPTIRVCTQDSQARSCTKPIIYTDTSTVAVEVVHPQAAVFDVEIVISNITQPTLFLLDDIEYKADLCENSQTNAREQNLDDQNIDVVEEFFNDDADSGGESRRGDLLMRKQEDDHSNRVDGVVERSTACHLLSCNFTTDFCGYHNYQNDTMSLVEWQLGNHRIGNIHTGIKGNEEANGGFLFVGTDSSTLGVTTYILESPEFSLSKDMKLSFDVYRRSKDITLQVCLNTPFNCPYTVSPFDKRVHWKQGETFEIPRSTKKVYFKAIQWKKFKWLAIDNIQLNPCPRSSSTTPKTQ